VVAPHAGAWIETEIKIKEDQASTSRPTRARGLKHHPPHLIPKAAKSRPTRARGLKQIYACSLNTRKWSRPTRARGLKQQSNHQSHLLISSRPTRARGLKHNLNIQGVDLYGVAPHAGAWIETNPITIEFVCGWTSRPTRARGLKPKRMAEWVKMNWSRPTRARGLKHVYTADGKIYPCRAPRGRVD